jgi:hypothetical protein
MQPSLFDATRPVRRLSTPYARGSVTSKAAARKADHFVGVQGATVLTAIRQAGERGLTQKECHAVTGIERPSLCARFNALEQRGDIQKTAQVREHCAVYRVT